MTRKKALRSRVEVIKGILKKRKKVDITFFLYEDESLVSTSFHGEKFRRGYNRKNNSSPVFGDEKVMRKRGGYSFNVFIGPKQSKRGGICEMEVALAREKNQGRGEKTGRYHRNTHRAERGEKTNCPDLPS